MCSFFFFKQKTAYEMRISDWSSDVCASDLPGQRQLHQGRRPALRREPAPARRVLPRPVPGAGHARHVRQLQGKELSYNNLADADAAWECVRQFDAPRSEERSVGKACVSTWRSRWSLYHLKKTPHMNS